MKKLMTHLYWGDPNQGFSFDLAKTLLDAGTDILEVGVPYTDPMCDGPVFQAACHRAIAAGTTPLDVFAGIRKIRDAGYPQPIYLTSYFGPIFKMGIETWMKKAKEVQVAGLIIPDILLEEQTELQQQAKRYGLSVIQFATVYSSSERLKQIIAASTHLPAQAGYIYCIALPGVTGDASVEQQRLETLIKKIKTMTELPIYVGFGIRTPEDVATILSYGADGVIVGSAIAKQYESSIATDVHATLPEIHQFVKSLKLVTMGAR